MNQIYKDGWANGYSGKPEDTSGLHFDDVSEYLTGYDDGVASIRKLVQLELFEIVV